ncbi:hypothetical protein GPECTOR_26g571 [Gonium pectorale]|uniref:Uncharacterized protein n=1 Tax=Gonium pectorale TaxID=33097 RepID=A0A150GFQ1_GONPE|nr:hypothetical protein GPECTOR_26g571 [Gonium pectorale]|eukprot:KXZ48668.1 hypothetical protein GPECTOR_26g571 [Gonium pectorale]
MAAGSDAVLSPRGLWERSDDATAAGTAPLEAELTVPSHGGLLRLGGGVGLGAAPLQRGGAGVALPRNPPPPPQQQQLPGLFSSHLESDLERLLLAKLQQLQRDQGGPEDLLASRDPPRSWQHSQLGSRGVASGGGCGGRAGRPTTAPAPAGGGYSKRPRDRRREGYDLDIPIDAEELQGPIRLEFRHRVVPAEQEDEEEVEEEEEAGALARSGPPPQHGGSGRALRQAQGQVHERRPEQQGPSASLLERRLEQLSAEMAEMQKLVGLMKARRRREGEAEDKGDERPRSPLPGGGGGQRTSPQLEAVMQAVLLEPMGPVEQ